MQRSFLLSYLEAFHHIPGWFSYDAALMFMAYNQLIADAGVAADVLEIGVYYGLSSIALAAVRGAGRRMYAIDLFEELEEGGGYGSGANYRKQFEQNMASFFGKLDFLQIVTGASGKLRSLDYPQSFSFCHVDGGHSAQETYDDVKFASDILIPGGLLGLDDYFNPEHPGVCEGAVDFARRHAGVLRPIAIGYNKVLFQRLPAPFDLNTKFSEMFPAVPHGESILWETPVHLYGKAFRSCFDLYASEPARLAPMGAAGVRARISPAKKRLDVRPEGSVALVVAVKNTSGDVFPHGERVFGLSYHLLSAKGETIRHDNRRTYFASALEPGQEVSVNLEVEAPSAPGRYQVEIDLVWEGVMWFKDVGNPTGVVELEVS
jgi:predicted O-methyltransferase YrrM